VGLGTLVFNTAVLASLWIAGPALAALGAGIMAGAAVRLTSQLSVMPRSAWRTETTHPFSDSTLLRDFCSATLAAALTLMAPVFLRALASTQGEGSIAAFSYALKLVELPAAILLGSIATVALTTLSEQMSNGSREQAMATAHRHIQQGVLLAVAVVGIGTGFASPLVRLVLSRGAMDSGALETVALLLQTALLGTPALAISSIATAWLNAARQPAVVLKRSTICLALLPLLAIPGIQQASGPMLMGAMVVFQVLLAAALLRAAKIVTFGSGGWLNTRMLAALVLSLTVAGLFAAIDTSMATRSDVLRAALAMSGFAVATFLSMRLSRGTGQANQNP
jgi:peptidoglycan biosynthesis protein MviN/MurJ (putative lipid II flippase)